MYVLSGQSLTRSGWFAPESMSLNLEERKSTAGLQMGPDDPEFNVGTWLLDETDPGSGIIWRAKTIDTQFETKTRKVQMEHVINTLRDVVLFGVINPKIITGNSGAVTCTAKQAMQYILGKQNIWTLGTFDSSFDNVSNPYSFNGENIFDALETITASLDGAYWDFNLSSIPFALNIKKLDDTVASEMRMSRNIQTMRKTVDRSRMYTRLYPIGKNNLHIDSSYISKNEQTYGMVAKIETDNSKGTKSELLRWATERLDRHCEPSVTITISGLELSQATGEPLDHIEINKACRVPLPEFSTTITEKVSKLSWNDKIGDPERVTVTLANLIEDVASIMNSQAAAAARGSVYGAQRDADDHAWIVDTSDHVTLVAEAIIGQGPDGVNWSRVAQLGVDGYGIHGSVTRAEEYMVMLESRLEMTEERLTIEFTNAINSTRSEFQMTSESLRISFENENASLRSEINVQAGRIGLVVTGEGTSAAINISAITDGINNDSSVEIIGDRITIGAGSNRKKVKVYIDGEITATNAQITNLTTGTTKATLINTTALAGDTVTGGTVYAVDQLSVGSSSQGGSGTLYYRGSQYYSQGILLGTNGAIASGYFLGNSNTNMNLDHYHTIVAEEGTGADAGKIIITLTDPVATSDTTNHTTNFNIAATQTYIDGVAAGKNSVKVSGPTWASSPSSSPSSNSNTATFTTDAASPSQATPKSLALYLSRSDSWSNNVRTVYLSHTDSSTAGYRVAKIDVDASSLVTSATRSGKASVTLNDPTWNSVTTVGTSRTVTVSTSGRTNSSGTTENLSKSVTISVSVDSSNAYVKHGSTTVAQVAHSYKYTQAQYDARYTEGGQAAWFKYTDNDQPKATNWALLPGKYMTGFYKDAGGTVHEWNTSWGPVPSGATPVSSNLQIDSYEYKTSQPTGTQAQNMWTSIKNGWNDPTMKYWRFRVYMQNPNNTSQIWVSKNYWFQYT